MNLLVLFADLEQNVIALNIRTVFIASVALISLTIIAALLKNHAPKLKLPLFILMSGTIVITTLTLLIGTIYVNIKSESKGPVHWHADFELWSCGAELELRGPQGFLSNKIGTSTYHEHDDKRIHLEGVVMRSSWDASLGKFFQVVGGHISRDSVAIPLNPNQDEWFASKEKSDGDIQRPENFNIATGDGAWVSQTRDGPVLTLKNGNHCGDSSVPAEVQVFAYKFDEKNKTYQQYKLDDPAAYVIRGESLVPPGDCIIVEFDEPKSVTDKLCREYGVRDQVRCADFGVVPFNPDLCEIREINKDTDSFNILRGKNTTSLLGYNGQSGGISND